MADWTNQDTNSLLPGEPWTSAKAIAAFENPVAIAEQAAGAPKIANKITGGEQDTTFSGMGTYGGVLIWGQFRGTGGGAATNKINVSASTNGSTYGAASQMVEVDNIEMTPFQIFIDFATGAWQSAYDTQVGGSTDGTYTTGTLANTDGITHLRITLDGAGSQASYLVMPQGGASAS